MDDDGHAIDDWPQVLGPQSDDEPMEYGVRIDDDLGVVTLIGPAPGMKYQYERDAFESLVDQGEWLPARVDYERELYETPEGPVHW